MKIRINTSIELLDKIDKFSDLSENVGCEIQSTIPGWYSLQVDGNELFLGNRCGFIRQFFAGDGHIEIDYATPGKGSGYIYVTLRDSLCHKNYLAMCYSAVFRKDLLESAIRLSDNMAKIIGIRVMQQHTGADC
jgi:hypothetical protein